MSQDSITDVSFYKKLGLDQNAGNIRFIVGVIILLSLIILPIQISSSQQARLIYIFYLVLFALSWDIFSGYSGELSFGHAFFFAIGGYSTAVLNLDFGLPLFVSIPIGVVITGFIGLAVSFLLIRTRGIYFSIITLILPFILIQIFVIFNGTFRGRAGFVRSPTKIVSTFPESIITVGSPETVITVEYYLTLIISLFIFLASYKYMRGPFGQTLTAIKEEEQAVNYVGIDSLKFLQFSLLVSAIIGGIAGSLFVHSSVGHPSPPEILNFQLSMLVVLMVIIGGSGTTTGAIIGAFLFGFGEIILDSINYMLPILNSSISDLMPIPLLLGGVLLILVKVTLQNRENRDATTE